MKKRHELHELAPIMMALFACVAVLCGCVSTPPKAKPAPTGGGNPKAVPVPPKIVPGQAQAATARAVKTMTMPPQHSSAPAYVTSGISIQPLDTRPDFYMYVTYRHAPGESWRMELNTFKNGDVWFWDNFSRGDTNNVAWTVVPYGIASSGKPGPPQMFFRAHRLSP